MRRRVCPAPKIIWESPAPCAMTRMVSPPAADGLPVAGQLRFPIDVPDVNQNLCMKCHQRRAEPESGSARGSSLTSGPHAAG